MRSFPENPLINFANFSGKVLLWETPQNTEPSHRWTENTDGQDHNLFPVHL